MFLVTYTNLLAMNSAKFFSMQPTLPCCGGGIKSPAYTVGELPDNVSPLRSVRRVKVGAPFPVPGSVLFAGKAITGENGSVVR